MDSNVATGEKVSQQYPYPSQVNASSFLSIELWGEPNYVVWREQMTCLLESYDMLGFIDGTLEKPEENMYREWKRSDTLVKGWIYGSLSEDVMETVVGLQTAYEVWNKLKTNYTTPPAPAPVAVKDFGEYFPLSRAIINGDWEKAQEFFNDNKEALIGKINEFGHTTLHVAIGDPKNIWILEKLLEQINPESLPTMVGNKQQNALHYAALLDNYLAAKMLVEKNPDLLFRVDYQNYLPIQRAIFNSHKTTFLYLLQVCKQHIGLSKKDGNHDPFEGEKGVSLLNCAILAGFLDVAYNLLKDYPNLATTVDHTNTTPLWCIAKKWDAFPSGTRYNFYQRFVYSLVPTDNRSIDRTNKNKDIENQVTYTTNLLKDCNKSCVYPVVHRIYVKIWKAALLRVPHIKRLHEDKVKHNIALMILRFICEEVSKLKSDHSYYYHDSYIVAVNNNTIEVIEQITQSFPQSIWDTNDGYSLSGLSIINRCEKVYNFLAYEVTQDKYLHTVSKDKNKNNLLHLAGKLAPKHKLNMVSGAALQLQRELQWFEEVRKFVKPKYMEALNNKQETPIMVFRKEHNDLRQKGEDWMKKTSESYTITAALIITIVFAAAITVPGGIKGDTGKPTFQTRPSFIVFAVSDAISLFTSTTSLLLFLSILTARYTEEDFLYKLPNRLILGLVMLFMSLTSMMIAFSATLYIMFGQEKSWILIPVAALTCLPIASFVTLQLPLLVDLMVSTYGRGIFGKQSYVRITS
ncbi:putative ankyrin repeat-containing domain, PGG domain, retrotransposon Copia-like protein [Helianthus annuus]|nr:putative ankyrin repeat-containing domain, PGG domain, retrotransposon Copia-like protein [Helianthus annuus]